MNTLSFIGFTQPFSAMSHFIGALVCLCYSFPFIKSEPRVSYRYSLFVFCFACVFLLVLSGVFHLLPLESSGRMVLQRLDHAAIFILIAGTFTPIHIILFRGHKRWGPLGFIWLIAITGITLKSIYFREIPELWSMAVYLGMGWLGIVTASMIWAEQGWRTIEPLFFGALYYSLGALLDFFKGPVLISGVLGAHELFHLAVLCGIAYHWRFIRDIVPKEENRAESLHAPQVIFPPIRG